MYTYVQLYVYCARNLIRSFHTAVCILQLKYTQFTTEIIIPFVRHGRIDKKKYIYKQYGWI